MSERDGLRTAHQQITALSLGGLDWDVIESEIAHRIVDDLAAALSDDGALDVEAVTAALRDTLARYDAVIVLDPSKGYHYGSGPSVEFVGKGLAARLREARQSGGQEG